MSAIGSVNATPIHPASSGQGFGTVPGAAPTATDESTPPDKRSVLQAATKSAQTDLSKPSPEEQAQVRELRRRDQEVRAHEAAHAAAGGAYVRGGVSYSYTTGPDGKRYAAGGEVGIDTAPVPNNPDATIAKMQTVRRAALAPANPSGQDMAVAAKAAQTQAVARMEAAAKAMEEAEEILNVEAADKVAQYPTAEAPSDAVAPPPGALLDLQA
jgi:hypothetical protein